MARLLSALALALCAGSALAVCPNDCFGHGKCNKYSMCECYRNWMAADCSQRVCRFGVAFVDTPQGDLNADGYVSAETFETQKGNAEDWEIYPWYAGWGGATYKFATSADSTLATHARSFLVTRTGSAQGEAHMYKECSAKGTCDRGSGECQCFAGYEGEACARTSCPNDCGGHGVCLTIGEHSERTGQSGSWGPKYAASWYGNNGYDGTTYTGWDRHKTQACQCDPGFFGDDCSKRACPKGDDPVTKYRSYTRIKLTDDTAANWYDTQACPATGGTQTVAASAVGVGTTTYAFTVDTAGFGYDLSLGVNAVKIAKLVAADNCVLAAQSAQSVAITNNAGAADGVIGVGAVLTFAAASLTDASCNANSLLKVRFTSPSTFAWNSRSRAAAGLLPTRVWTWEKAGTGNALFDAVVTHTAGDAVLDASHRPLGGFVWNAWYSAFDAANGKAVAPVSGGAGSAECDYHASDSTSCKYKTIRYDSTADRGQSVADDASATVTGSTSMASGTITNGCCNMEDVSADGKICSQCNFFDVLLKDVDGTFNTGDVLRVNWPRMDLLGSEIGVVSTTADALLTSITTQPTAADAAVKQVIAGNIVTSGSGTGVAFTITIASNAVTAISVTAAGVGYAVGDTLTVTAASIATATGAAASAGLVITLVADDFNSDPPRTHNYYDRNGFELCNYIDSISTYYAANAGNVQENEIQILQIRYETVACFGGYFALEFEDEFGDVWTTEAVAVDGQTDVTSAAGAIAATDAAHAALAARIEDALEALPNKVLEDVDVDFAGVDTAAPSFDETAVLRHFTISFVSNTGNIPTLGVSYSLSDGGAAADCTATQISTNTQCGGHEGFYRLPSGCAVTATTGSDGSKVITAIACTDSGEGLPFVPTFDVTVHSTGGSGAASNGNAVVNGAVTDGKASFTVISGGNVYTEPITVTIGVPASYTAGTFRENCVPIGGGATLPFSSVGDAAKGYVRVLPGDAPTSGGVTDEAVEGSTENVECSNRGICDYATGACKCFTGFTTEDCSHQNALAMG